MNMHIGEVYAITAIVSAMLTLLVYIRMKFALHRQAIEPSFVYMLRFFILFNLVDALWGLCYAGIFFSPLLFTVVGYGYHTLSSISAFVWLLYVTQFTRHRRIVHRGIIGAGIALLLAQLAIILTNPFHHLVFEVTSDNQYLLHGLRYTLYGLELTYYAIILLLSGPLALLDSEQNREKHKSAFVYSLAPALFCVGQIIFYNVAMYSLGFAYVALLICLFRQSGRIEKLRQDQFRAVSHEQLSIIRSLTDNYLFIYYVDLQTGQYDRFVRADTPLGLAISRHDDKDFFREATAWGRANVDDKDLEQFLLVISKENIVKTLEQRPEVIMILKIRQGDRLVYHEGRITRSADTFAANRIIVAVYDIDARHRAQLQQNEELAKALDQKTALEREASMLDLAAHRDIMTGLFNRRAYEDNLEAMGGKPDAADFVYVSLDVNGLKAVNDDLGHDAGDELIKGAALCMKQCFADLGKVYRHGGDEFSAILHAEADTLGDLFAHFEQVVSEWRGRLIDSLAVSFGYATASEDPSASIEDLEKLADQRMYEYKIRYYARKGIDRRAQQEAYEALRESYTKVLKVDLKEDSFAIIKTDERELDSKAGFSDRFSEWVHSFAKAGYVHENDRDEYLQKTGLDYIRKFFAQPKGNLAFRYKRKTEDGFGETMMEMIPAHDYGPDRQIIFLYVKKVGGEGLYMRLHELENNVELTVQMLWEKNSLEFQSALVKKDELGIYIKPYLREDRAIRFNILLTDKMQCNLYAPSRAGGRVMWHDVELKSVDEPEGVLYRISTQDFNQYSRPGDRRFHERRSSAVTAKVWDMTLVTTEVVLHDISDTGLSFYVDSPIQFGSDIINIAFADTVCGEDFRIKTTAKIVRNYSERGKTFYGCLMIDAPRDYQLYVFMYRMSRSEN